MHDTIYKYPIEIEDEFWVEMPPNSEVLSVGVQGGVPVIWAKVQAGQHMSRGYGFKLRGTGHPLDGSEGRFIGTFQLNGGGLIFHMFEAI